MAQPPLMCSLTGPRRARPHVPLTGDSCQAARPSLEGRNQAFHFDFHLPADHKHSASQPWASISPSVQWRQTGSQASLSQPKSVILSPICQWHLDLGADRACKSRGLWRGQGLQAVTR
jgi:hypothetical protein